MLQRLAAFGTAEEYLAHTHEVCAALKCVLSADHDIFATLLDGDRPPAVALAVAALARLRPNTTSARALDCEQWVHEALDDAHGALAELMLRAVCRVLGARPGPLVRVVDLATWVSALSGALECAASANAHWFLTRAWMPCCASITKVCPLYRKQLAEVVLPEVEGILRDGGSISCCETAAMLGIAQFSGLAPSALLYTHAATFAKSSEPPSAAVCFIAHVLVSADGDLARAVASAPDFDTEALRAITGIDEAPIYGQMPRAPKPERRMDPDLARFLDEGLRISAQTSTALQSNESDDAFSDGHASETGDVDMSTRTNSDGIAGLDERLLQAYIRDRSAFGRSAAVRASPGRRALLAATGLAHEQLEGWAVVFERNPSCEAVARDYALMFPDRV